MLPENTLSAINELLEHFFSSLYPLPRGGALKYFDWLRCDAFGSSEASEVKWPVA